LEILKDLSLHPLFGQIINQVSDLTINQSSVPLTSAPDELFVSETYNDILTNYILF
jgi:hypothetical protein